MCQVLCHMCGEGRWNLSRDWGVVSSVLTNLTLWNDKTLTLGTEYVLGCEYAPQGARTVESHGSVVAG